MIITEGPTRKGGRNPASRITERPAAPGAMHKRATADQLQAVLNILTNARDAALIDKVAIELGLEPSGGGLSFLGHLQMAAQAVGADVLPVHFPQGAVNR